MLQLDAHRFSFDLADLSEICIFILTHGGCCWSCSMARVQIFDILSHVRRWVHSEVPVNRRAIATNKAGQFPAGMQKVRIRWSCMFSFCAWGDERECVAVYVSGEGGGPSLVREVVQMSPQHVSSRSFFLYGFGLSSYFR